MCLGLRHSVNVRLLPVLGLAICSLPLGPFAGWALCHVASFASLVSSFHAPLFCKGHPFGVVHIGSPQTSLETLPIRGPVFLVFIFHPHLLATIFSAVFHQPLLVYALSISFRVGLLSYLIFTPISSSHHHIPSILSLYSTFFLLTCFLPVTSFVSLSVPVYPTHTYTLVQHRLSTRFPFSCFFTLCPNSQVIPSTLLHAAGPASSLLCISSDSRHSHDRFTTIYSIKTSNYTTTFGLTVYTNPVS